jgi:hypothetical protein
MGQASPPAARPARRNEDVVAHESEWAAEKRAFVEGRETVGPLAREFSELAADLLTETTVKGVLERVVHAARAVVPADMVSVTLGGADGWCTPVETDALAGRLDALQYALDEGPCLSAAVPDGTPVVLSGDLGSDDEFTRFGPAAARLAVHCVLAVQLFPPGSMRVGALNFYSRRPGGLDERDRDIAVVLAAHASTALAATLAVEAADLERAQLRQALQTRDVIGQAKGILMERRGISADEAFEVLRDASQALNVKLARVALTLVERRAQL